jgi:hypothetical protein
MCVRRKPESTQSNLMLASSSVFCTRSTWLDCSRTNCLRVQQVAHLLCLRIRHEARSDQTASPTKTAWDAYTEQRGVCRDFAHLAGCMGPAQTSRRTLTVTTRGTDAGGKQVNTVAVYDKQ